MTSKHKRHRPLSAREVALQALVQVEREHAYSNLALNRVLQGIDSKEAALATELVYGTIQRQNTIDYYLDKFVARRLDKLETKVLCLLRMSFYQLHYLHKIPDHAVVNEAVHLARRFGHRGIAGMVNGVLRSVLRARHTLILPESLPQADRLSLLHSHPKWMVLRWANQFGWEQTEQMLHANNLSPVPAIRVNALRHERDQYVQRLRDRGQTAEASAVSAAGILWRGGNPAHDPGFAQGEFTIQDESSMLVGAIVAPKRGMKVLDACAAPGGKTTHLAELMGDDGQVWANDIHAHKEKLIMRQAHRLDLHSVRTLSGDAARLSERFPAESFDRILLDAPCSGLGVIRRKPDLKWQKNETDIPQIVAVQQRLLRTLSKLLKPGGIFVYSTCTLEQKENEQLVRAFLREAPEFVEDEEITDYLPPTLPEHARVGTGMVRIFPHDYGSDGFFIARLRKKT